MHLEEDYAFLRALRLSLKVTMNMAIGYIELQVMGLVMGYSSKKPKAS